MKRARSRIGRAWREPAISRWREPAGTIALAFAVMLALAAAATGAASERVSATLDSGTARAEERVSDAARGGAGEEPGPPVSRSPSPREETTGQAASESRSESGAPRAAAPAHRGAIAIRKPLPVPPVEAAGTGITPSASLRVTVDEKGRVAAIDVKGLQPSTPYDAFYERELRRTLSEWRFAPALENGRPAKATLEWKVKFEPKEPGASGPNALVLPNGVWGALPGAVEDEDTKRWIRFLASLPLEERRRVLSELRTTAEKHLGGSRSVDFRKGPFVVITDATEAAARAVAQDIGVVMLILDDLFKAKVPPQPSTDPIYAYLFTSRDSLHALNAEYHGWDLAEGFYKPPGLIAVHMEHGSSNDVVSVLLHESVHAYLDRFIVRPGITIPAWVNEGLAEFVANSDIRDGKIEPGGHKQRAVTYRNPMVSWRGPSAAYLGADEVKKAILAKKAIPLIDLVAAEGNVFYGEKHRLYYTESWMFVHFLMKGKPSWSSEEFPRFLLSIAEGFPPSASFRAAYGSGPESMEEEFRSYVKSF